MSNKLVLYPKGRNHFKFMPGKDRELPEDEKEQIELCESVYNNLIEYGSIIYTKSRKGSYMINALKMGELYYIVVCIRNEFGTYNNIIYELTNENDALVISKFIGKNIRTTMKDYKKQILDAWKYRKEVEHIEKGQISESSNHEEN